MPSPDHYTTLGVPRNADASQIRAAYRALARRLHPDVNKSKNAEERFKAVNEAYQVLSDADKRARYDRYGPDWERYQAPKGDAQADFSQWFSRRQRPSSAGGSSSRTGRSTGDSGLFDSVFGSTRSTRQRGGTRAQRGEDHEYPVHLELREAFAGTTRIFEAVVPATCVECDGTGIRFADVCPVCDGAGVTHARTKLEVTIPPGVQEGQRIRVAGKGSPGPNGGPAGDIYLKVAIRVDQRFTLENVDLRIDVDVPLYTALLGGEIVVTTLTGKLSLTIPPETQNGRVFRLRGQGWPVKPGTHERGDLLARIRVNLPQQLSDDERATFERLRAARAPTSSRSTA